MRPNVIFVFADQWRAQATGYAGDPNVKTPHLDRLAAESVNFTNAIAGCPVCSPYRASFLTGRFPLTHGVFVNDVYLKPSSMSIAEAFAAAGYDTAYIGKWHVDGHGRSNYIPPERRLGFEYWKALECTHDYNHSAYYSFDSDEARFWDGYDAIVQTEDARKYIISHDRTKPFFLVLSWGPPHAPYHTAPPEYRALYDPSALVLRENVPPECERKAREDLAGYYAHCSALDACIGRLLETIRKNDLEKNTILVFTSDHGDMLGSQGEWKKQRPWDESIRVPFLLHWPNLEHRDLDAVIDAPDIMPTLLGLCGIPVPDTVEGIDFSGYIRGDTDPSEGAACIMCVHPFGQWNRIQHQGREYRGLRTKRYTYVRALEGPWLLYDNEKDPFQRDNLIHTPEHASLAEELDKQLQKILEKRCDSFLPGMEYIRKWGYTVDEYETVPYTD